MGIDNARATADAEGRTALRGGCGDGEGDAMRHPKAEEWEKRLKRIFDRINDELEREYGARFARHPARAPHGATSNREHDGLFDVGAVFTPGYGTKLGPGYVLEVHLATLDPVPADFRRRIEDEVAEKLRAELPSAFPGRNLQVRHDGQVYRIVGDLGLGHA